MHWLSGNHIYTEEDLAAFHAGRGRNQEGYTVEKILKKGPWFWDKNHAFIQWCFPTREKSAHNSKAPVLSGINVPPFPAPFLPALYARFREEIETRGYIRPGNHWCLRATRVLLSLRAFGMEKEAEDLYAYLSRRAEADTGLAKARAYWDRAMAERFV